MEGDLESHHIIRRNHRVTKLDVMNGVPVCKLECHGIAHRNSGKRIIDERLGASHCEYLDERENILVKDYKMAMSFSTMGLEEYELANLKKELAKYQED